MSAPAGPAGEQAMSIRLDIGCGMARYGPQKASVLPKQDDGKTQARDDSCQDKAANGRASDAGSPPSGQHPSLQLAQVPAHPDFPFGLAFHVGCGSGQGRLGIVRCRPASVGLKPPSG